MPAKPKAAKPKSAKPKAAKPEAAKPEAAKPKPRGALIVIEGLDKAGKSTQCEKLFNYFEQQGRPVKRMRFPGLQSLLSVLVRQK